MALPSFIEIPADSDFPVENLPYGVFKPEGKPARVGVAVGGQILDLSVIEEAGCLGADEKIFSSDSLNRFLALGRPSWQRTRTVLQELLAADNPALRDRAELREQAFHAQSDVAMQLPARVGDYTDFYSSYHHAH